MKTSYDPRYAFETCPKCGRDWQRIDWGCSRHQLTCGYPVPAMPSSVGVHSRTVEQWQAWDEANLSPQQRGLALREHEPYDPPRAPEATPRQASASDVLRPGDEVRQ